MNNRYIKNAKISESKLKELIKYFALDLDGLQIAELSGLNRNTVSRYLNLIRQRIANYCEENLPPRLLDTIDVQNNSEKTSEFETRYKDTGLIFGLFKASDKIHTELVNEMYTNKFRDIVRGLWPWETLTYNTDCWYNFDGLIEIGKSKYFRLNQTPRELADKQSHLNSIKSFWSFAQMRLLKFRGVARHTFYLHLKECEFRFNNRNKKLYPLVLDLLKEKPLE